MDAQEYVAELSSSQKSIFQRIQNIVMAIAPDAELVMSYGIPTFKYRGKILLHVGAFKDHMSIFPGSEATQKFADRLRGYKISKGTIQFTVDNPLPDEILREIVQMRFDQI